MGTAFAPGPLFFTDGQGAYHLRLNMVAHPAEIIAEGMRRLAAAWRALAANYQPLDTAPTTPFL